MIECDLYKMGTCLWILGLELESSIFTSNITRKEKKKFLFHGKKKISNKNRFDDISKVNGGIEGKLQVVLRNKLSKRQLGETRVPFQNEWNE